MALRKVDPVHHIFLKDDLLCYLRSFAQTDVQQAARENALSRLRKVVRRLDEDYELVDISLETIKGRQPSRNSPLECYISDHKNPLGLTSSHGTESLPVAYDALSLSRLLTDQSFKGTIINCIPDTKGDSPGQFPVESPKELQWGDLYIPFNSSYPILSPILRIVPREADEPEILLHPAHPSHSPRWAFIKEKVEKYAEFGVLFGFLWQWTQSWGLPHFTQSTCALLVINALQRKFGGNPSEVAQGCSTISVRLESEGTPEYISIDVPTTSVNSGGSHKYGPLLQWLFETYSRNSNALRNQIIDIRTNDSVERQEKPFWGANDLDGQRISAQLVDFVKKAKEKGTLRELGTKHQPLTWKYQPLVIVDPILPCHNVSHSVTKGALQAFQRLCAMCVKHIALGHPLASIIKTSPPLSPLRLYHNENQPVDKQENARSEFFSITRTPPSVFEARSRVIARIQSLIQEQFGKNFTVECFGSTQYGADSPSSDLDLVIIDHDRMSGFAPDVDLKALPAIYDMKKLAEVVRKEFKVSRVILKATVPIVKLQDKMSRIRCDINVNDQLGAFNTLLIARYCKLSPLLRLMMLAIKKWAKSNGLNSPSGDGPVTFSSYALTLMTIGFLQVHDLLPNIQDGLPPLNDRDGFWVRTSTGGRIHCDPRYNKSMVWASPIKQEEIQLRDAFVSWLSFWGYEFKYDEQLMSIRDGGLLPRTKAPLVAKETKDKDTGAQTAQTLDDAKNTTVHTAVVLETTIVIKPEPEGDTDRPIPVPEAPLSNVLDDSDEVIYVAEDAPPEAEPITEIDEIALDEFEEVDLRKGRQPKSWLFKSMVVADPFIVSKNCTGSINPHYIDRFRWECQRAVWLLDCGYAFDQLLGDGSLFDRSSRPKPKSKAPKAGVSSKKGKSGNRVDRKGKGKEVSSSAQAVVGHTSGTNDRPEIRDDEPKVNKPPTRSKKNRKPKQEAKRGGEGPDAHSNHGKKKKTRKQSESQPRPSTSLPTANPG